MGQVSLYTVAEQKMPVVLRQPEIEGEQFASELLAGYAEVSPIDERALDASLVIRAGIMLNTFGRREAELGIRIAGVFARMRGRIS